MVSMQFRFNFAFISAQLIHKYKQRDGCPIQILFCIHFSAIHKYEHKVERPVQIQYLLTTFVKSSPSSSPSRKVFIGRLNSCNSSKITDND